MGWLVVAVPFVAGLYLAWLTLAPAAIPLPPANMPAEQVLPALAEPPTINRVLISKIGVDVPLGSEGEAALDRGAWHRHPQRGSPASGGNFIVSAHRFELGLTPGDTVRKSPFYHLDKLNIGDEIVVDFGGQRYRYAIRERQTVKPSQVEIEAPSAEAKLTLYSCTLRGESDGRDVLIATKM